MRQGDGGDRTLSLEYSSIGEKVCVIAGGSSLHGKELSSVRGSHGSGNSFLLGSDCAGSCGGGLRGGLTDTGEVVGLVTLGAFLSKGLAVGLSALWTGVTRVTTSTVRALVVRRRGISSSRLLAS